MNYYFLKISRKHWETIFCLYFGNVRNGHGPSVKLSVERKRHAPAEWRQRRRRTDITKKIKKL